MRTRFLLPLLGLLIAGSALGVSAAELPKLKYKDCQVLTQVYGTSCFTKQDDPVCKQKAADIRTCLSRVDANDCQNYPSAERDQCYASLGNNNQTPDACAVITASGYRNACYRKLSLQQNNVKICDRISDKRGKSDCYGSFAATRKKPEVCGTLPETSQADACLKQAAVAMRDSFVCDKITVLGAWWNCMSAVAVVNRDVQICVDILDLTARNTCIASIAKATGSMSFCQVVRSSQEDKERCIAGVATVTGDAELCKALTIRTSIDSCYYGAAIRSKKPELCAKVSNRNVASICETVAK